MMSCVIGGIKHDFPFINIRKVLREGLKTEGEALNLRLYSVIYTQNHDVMSKVTNV